MLPQVFKGRANGLLNSYLTRFKRSLLTYAVGLCQVKAYYTELADTNYYMAVNKTHHSQMHPTLTLVVLMRFITL